LRRRSFQVLQGVFLDDLRQPWRAARPVAKSVADCQVQGVKWLQRIRFQSNGDGPQPTRSSPDARSSYNALLRTEYNGWRRPPRARTHPPTRTRHQKFTTPPRPVGAPVVPRPFWSFLQPASDLVAHCPLTTWQWGHLRPVQSLVRAVRERPWLARTGHKGARARTWLSRSWRTRHVGLQVGGPFAVLGRRGGGPRLASFQGRHGARGGPDPDLGELGGGGVREGRGLPGGRGAGVLWRLGKLLLARRLPRRDGRHCRPRVWI